MMVSNTYCVVVLFVFLRLVYTMLPVSLECPFLIAPSVFSNVLPTVMVNSETNYPSVKHQTVMVNNIANEFNTNLSFVKP